MPDELHGLIVRAWEYAKPIARSMARRYGDHDFESAIGLYLCYHARAYDPARHTLREWATYKAKTACHNLLKQEKVGRLRSIVRASPRTGRSYTLDVPYVPPPGTIECEDAFDEVLRGLLPRERAAIVGTMVEGRMARDVGSDLGVGELTIRNVRRGALAVLRERPPCR